MNEMESEETLMARFEELSVLETEFEDVELEISKQITSLVKIQAQSRLTARSPQSRSAPRASLQKARRVHHQDPPLLVPRLRASASRDRQLHSALRLQSLRRMLRHVRGVAVRDRRPQGLTAQLLAEVRLQGERIFRGQGAGEEVLVQEVKGLGRSRF
jgi:hypothetical protein